MFLSGATNQWHYERITQQIFCSSISLSKIDFFIQKAKAADADCFMISAFKSFTNYWSKSHVTKPCLSLMTTTFLDQAASYLFIILKKTGCPLRLKIWLKIAKTSDL